MLSSLRPEELQVLRAQYEKEGQYVGIQTKFNYAWVWTSYPFEAWTVKLLTGLDQVGFAE